MNNIKFPFKIFLIGILASYPFSIVFLQNLAIGIENNYLTLKKDNITIDSLMSGGALIDDKELGGILAQGNSTPRSEFENHAIVKFNGKYYDPSYGSPISSNGNL